MKYFPDHLDRAEARIISRLITAILTLSPVPLFVRVHDGEEWATDWTRDRRTICEAVAATDETRLVLVEGDATKGGVMRSFGSIWLIHGNGEEVISDATFSISWGAQDIIETADTITEIAEAKFPAEAVIDFMIDHANR